MEDVICWKASRCNTIRTNVMMKEEQPKAQDRFQIDGNYGVARRVHLAAGYGTKSPKSYANMSKVGQPPRKIISNGRERRKRHLSYCVNNPTGHWTQAESGRIVTRS